MPGARPGAMELRRYASLALRWLWLPVLGALVAAGIGYLVSCSQPPVYRASLKLLVIQTQGPSGPDYASLMASESLARTYAQLIPSRRVLDAAYRKLGLGTEEQTGSASARVVRDTQLITVSVEDRDPGQARDVATALAEVFVEQLTYPQLVRSESQTANARLGDAIRVVEPAELPTAPVRPKVAQDTLLAAIVGLFVSVGLGLLLERLRGTVRTDGLATPSTSPVEP